MSSSLLDVNSLVSNKASLCGLYLLGLCSQRNTKATGFDSANLQSVIRATLGHLACHFGCTFLKCVWLVDGSRKRTA